MKIMAIVAEADDDDPGSRAWWAPPSAEI